MSSDGTTIGSASRGDTDLLVNGVGMVGVVEVGDGMGKSLQIARVFAVCLYGLLPSESSE